MKKNIKICLISIILLILIVFGFKYKDYIPHDNEFSRTGNMTIPREGHKAVLLQDGRVLILGGTTCQKSFGIQTICGVSTNTTEYYNPKTGKFKMVGKMHVQNSDFTTTLLNNGKVLVVGSYDSPNLNNSELFNPETNKFEDTSRLIIPRSRYFTATLLKDGRVLIVGGLKESFNSSSLEILKEAELYDPNTGKFSKTGSLNISRFGHGAVLLNNGKVLIAGGTTKGKSLSSAELYDPKTGKFTQIGNMNFIRMNPELILLENGKVLIADGYDKDCSSNIELYDPIKNVFAAYDKPIKITKCTSKITLLKDGNILFVGGAPPVNGLSQKFGISNIYNSKLDKFEIGPITKVPHASHTVTLLNNGKVLVAGGKKKWGIENKAEIYNYKN